MPWTLVVVAEAVTVMADFHEPTVVLRERQWRAAALAGETEASGAVPGTSAAGVLEQHMPDVREQQLLMLLFMVRSELDEGCDRRPTRRFGEIGASSGQIHRMLTKESKSASMAASTWRRYSLTSATDGRVIIPRRGAADGPRRPRSNC